MTRKVPSAEEIKAKFCIADPENGDLWRLSDQDDGSLVYHERIQDFIQVEFLGFCNCGRPEDSLKYILAGMELIQEKQSAPSHFGSPEERATCDDWWKSYQQRSQDFSRWKEQTTSSTTGSIPKASLSTAGLSQGGLTLRVWNSWLCFACGTQWMRMNAHDNSLQQGNHTPV